MVTRHNHRVSAVYLPSRQCLISELLPAAPQYLVSSSETDLSPLCSPDSSVAESELAWRHIHGCINIKSIRDVSILKATLWVFFMLCTNAYLIDFGVQFLAWLSNSNTYIILISLEYIPVKWQWSCSLRWRRHICTPRHPTHGWESQEQTALRADRADTGAAFHCLLQNVWIRAKRTQKWLRGEANALLRGGHTEYGWRHWSNTQIRSLTMSLTPKCNNLGAINIRFPSFQTFCKSEKIVNLRTIISPGQFLVSGASSEGGGGESGATCCVTRALIVLFCIIPGSGEQAKTEQRYSVLLN